jgi:hypothetical protein
MWQNGLLDKGFNKISDKKDIFMLSPTPPKHATKWGGLGHPNMLRKKQIKKLNVFLKKFVFLQRKRMKKISTLENAKKGCSNSKLYQKIFGSSKG